MKIIKIGYENTLFYKKFKIGVGPQIYIIIFYLLEG